MFPTAISRRGEEFGYFIDNLGVMGSNPISSTWRVAQR